MKTSAATASQQTPQAKIYDKNKPKVILRKSGTKTDKKPILNITKNNLFK